MHSHHRRITTGVVGSIALAFIFSAGGGAAGQGQQPSPLFEPVTVTLSRRPPLNLARYRTVAIDTAQLGGDFGARPVANTLTLNVFPELVLTADLEGIDRSPSGLVWVGRVRGQRTSSAIFAVVNGVVSGTITTADAIYSVTSVGGQQVIGEVEERLLPGGGADIVLTPPAVDEDAAPAGPPAVRDDPSRLDIAVFYTDDAAAGAGSEASVVAAINLAVSAANQAYATSGVALRIRNVYTGPASYTGSGSISTDLSRLRSTTDGILDGVHAVRNGVGADLIVLIAETDPGSCGIAYRLSPVASGATSAFGVVLRTCISNQTFAHEIGHNMGATHDWYVEDGAGAYVYSHGHVNAAGRWRSIMAYNNLCADSGFNCTRQNFFANPGISFQGAPTGIPENTDRSCTEGNRNNPQCDADVSRTINNMAQTLADFRQTITQGTGTGNRLAFPPRDQSFDFRGTQLENKYNRDLRRSPTGLFADPEGSVVWTQEYMVYRLNGCNHDQAVTRVLSQILNQGVPAVCVVNTTGVIAFPNRAEILVFRLDLERVYREVLRRPTTMTFVDAEGDVVWITEYLRYRLTNCSHAQAVEKVFAQIDGRGVQPSCAATVP